MGFLLILVARLHAMFKNFNCCGGLFINDNLLIFKVRNSKFDVKDNFVNNEKNSNACRYLNSYALKRYEGRRECEQKINKKVLRF